MGFILLVFLQIGDGVTSQKVTDKLPYSTLSECQSAAKSARDNMTVTSLSSGDSRAVRIITTCVPAR